MEDLTNVGFTTQRLHSVADRVAGTMGITVWEFSIARKMRLRLRHVHIFGGLTISIHALL